MKKQQFEIKRCEKENMFGLKLKCVWGKLIYINLNRVWDGPRLAAIKYEKYLFR